MKNYLKTFAVGLFALLTLPIWAPILIIYAYGDISIKAYKYYRKRD